MNIKLELSREVRAKGFGPWHAHLHAPGHGAASLVHCAVWNQYFARCIGGASFDDSFTGNEYDERYVEFDVSPDDLLRIAAAAVDADVSAASEEMRRTLEASGMRLRYRW